MKILIVEDNDDSRVLLTTLLEGRGHTVESASDGLEAWKFVPECLPDMIITDLLMPKMDGYELCRKLKSSPDLAHIPVLVYTATYKGPEDIELGYSMGASRFIIKPQEPEALLRLINDAIEEYQEMGLPLPEKTKESNETLTERHLEAVARRLHHKMEVLEFKQNRTSEESIKLNNLAAELDKVNNDFSEFTYVMSHDLQEPLRKIAIFSDRLGAKLGQEISGEQEFCLTRLQKATFRMQTNIDDLLIFSTVLFHKIQLEDIQLEDVISKVQMKLALKIRKSKATINVEKLPVIISDNIFLAQLFNQLLSNSLQFIKEDEPPNIRIKDQTTGSDFIEIVVEDSGIGFDEKFLDRIFLPFQRLNGRDQYDGSGMGLAVCQKIVDRLGGSITAKSSPGKGAEFILRLPVAPSNKS
jgi:signal transduction histidine kinase